MRPTFLGDRERRALWATLIRYLSEQKLPRKMLQLQNGITTDNASASKSDGGITGTGEDWIEDVGIQGALEGVGTSPYVTGDFQIMSLGKIVKDPEYFRDERFNWPEVYAVRKFTSISVRRFIL